MEKLKRCFRKEKSQAKREIENLARQYQTDVHIKPKDQAMLEYETDFEAGLTEEAVNTKKALFGKNLLTPRKESPLIVKFFKIYFLNVFNILLNAGAILCIVAYSVDNSNLDNLYLSIVLLVVVLITSIFTTFQEYSSSKTMKSFEGFLPEQVNVYRAGELQEVPACDIVPGDVVLLKSGDKVPADCLVIKCSTDTKVDNSSLTGEAEPQHRSAQMTHKEPLETKNICFFGTLMVQGNATCMVFNTGDNTLMGGIARLAAGTSSEKTPIGKEINHFVFVISGIAIAIGITLGIINAIISKNAVDTLVLMIGIIVANIPEGLLITLTVALTLTSKKMFKRSVLVKNLEGVETLGSTSVICSDKTGTLTINKMTVSHIYYDQKERAVDTHEPKKGDFDAESAAFLKLIRCACLCNNAKFNKDKVIIGDASESALLKFCQPNLSLPVEKFRTAHKAVHNIPFNSKNKWQLSIHCLDEPAYSHLLAMKGAPERVLAFCDKIYLGGRVVPLGTEEREQISKGLMSFAKRGERVLGFCERQLETARYGEGYAFEGELPENANFAFPKSPEEEGFVFLGLCAMIDPPRPSVPESVLKCQSAGISVFMVTGDHPVTARAIATKVNILREKEPTLDLNELESPTLEMLERSTNTGCVVTGWHINHFTEEVSENDRTRFWNAILKHPHIVFSRTSPQHKLLIVQACQQRKAIVAVTGDGVNDSPALKKADIGIAMGIAGTAVAKNSADIILMDDNFSSIVNGVEEGRILFDNLKKSIVYTLSSNIPEIFPFILSVFMGLPLMLMTIQIFVIDLGTDMIPAISMAYEKKESDIMKLKPRNPQTGRLVTMNLIVFSYLMIGMMQMVAGVFTYFCIFKYYGFSLGQMYKLDKNKIFYERRSNGKNEFLTCFIQPHQHLATEGVIVANKYCIYTTRTSVPAEDMSNQSVYKMTVERRAEILAEANAAYVIAIVIVQSVDVIISKTRRNSVFSQGMANMFMNMGIVIEFLLICLLVYVPPIARFFKFHSVNGLFWVLPLPFFMLIFGFDELRKLIIRRNFKGYVKRNTYW